MALQSWEVKKLVYLYLLHYPEKYVNHIVSNLHSLVVCAYMFVVHLHVYVNVTYILALTWFL